MEEVFQAVGEDMPGLVNASFPSGYGSEVSKYNRITCILSSVYRLPVDLLPGAGGGSLLCFMGCTGMNWDLGGGGTF